MKITLIEFAVKDIIEFQKILLFLTFIKNELFASLQKTEANIITLIFFCFAFDSIVTSCWVELGRQGCSLSTE